MSSYLYSPTEYSKKHLTNQSSDSEKSEELSIAPGFENLENSEKFNFCEFRAKDFQLARLASSSSTASSTTSPCSPNSSTYSSSSNAPANATADGALHCTVTSLVKQRQRQMEQLAAAQRQLNSNSGRVRSMSSRELSMNSHSVSSTATSGDEEVSNFRAIVEKWKQRASNTDLNQLINSINNTSLAARTAINNHKTSKFNKDAWHSSVRIELFFSFSFFRFTLSASRLFIRCWHSIFRKLYFISFFFHSIRVDFEILETVRIKERL